MKEIKSSDQVIVRQRELNGNNVIKYGQVVSIEGSSALVHFPVEGVRRTIAVSQLELTSSRRPGSSSVGYVTSQRVGFEPYYRK